MGLGIVRIESKGFLEEGNRFRKFLGSQEFVARPALEIGIVGLCVLRVMASLLDLLLARQTDREGRDDLLRDPILQVEDVFECAVLTFRPEMPTCGRVT